MECLFYYSFPLLFTLWLYKTNFTASTNHCGGFASQTTVHRGSKPSKERKVRNLRTWPLHSPPPLSSVHYHGKCCKEPQENKFNSSSSMTYCAIRSLLSFLWPFISLSVKRGCWTWSLTSSFGFLPIPISGFDTPLTFLQRGKLLFWILAVLGFPAQLSLFEGNNGDFQVASTLPNTYLGVSEKATSTPSFHSLPDQGHVTSPKLNHVPPSPWRFSN